MICEIYEFLNEREIKMREGDEWIDFERNLEGQEFPTSAWYDYEYLKVTIDEYARDKTVG